MRTFFFLQSSKLHDGLIFDEKMLFDNPVTNVSKYTEKVHVNPPLTGGGRVFTARS